MPSYKYLPFIEDSKLTSAVEKVLYRTISARDYAEEALYRNVVDPFSALFDALTQNIPLGEWLEQEKSRQTQKTMQNAIGEFHQEALGGMRGWVDLGTREILDICNPSKKIVAEVKNKYNTTKGNHKMELYDAMEAKLAEPKFRGFTAYYVEIIPPAQKTYDVEFTPSDNTQNGKRRKPNPHIRKIDGKSFYDLASGHKNTLRSLFKVLPKIICKDKPIPQPKINEFMKLFGRAYK